MKKCPYCAEDIQDAAILCRFCGRDFPKARCWSCNAAIDPSASVCRACGERLVPLPATPPPLPQGASVPGQVNPVAAVIGALGTLAALGWFVMNVGIPGTGIPDASGRSALPTRLLDSPPVVTKSEYDQIRDGMTYQEVVRIIGASGEEQSRSDLAGYTTVMYSWMNSNGSNMNAMFQNEKLVQKAQFGLP